MKYYELTCVISPDFSEEKLIAYLPTKPIKKQLTSEEGLISLEFFAEPDEIKPLEKKLKDEASIQRYLILKKKPGKIEAKPAKRMLRETKTQLEKPKVELKEIEKKLDEILGENK